jgi:hypothetical protein
MALVGAILVFLGVVGQVLLSEPRRWLTAVARAGVRWRLPRALSGGDAGGDASMQSAHVASRPRHFGTHFAVFGAAMVKHASRRGRWITGR